MFLGDFGVPIASSCYRSIEITHLLHLMSPLFEMFESRLIWDPPHPLLSLLSCALCVCFGPGPSGTQPYRFFDATTADNFLLFLPRIPFVLLRNLSTSCFSYRDSCLESAYLAKKPVSF